MLGVIPSLSWISNSYHLGLGKIGKMMKILETFVFKVELKIETIQKAKEQVKCQLGKEERDLQMVSNFLTLTTLSYSSNLNLAKGENIAHFSVVLEKRH